MKIAYFLAIAVGAQDGGDNSTPHDPTAMAFCQGKFYLKKLRKIQARNSGSKFRLHFI